MSATIPDAVPAGGRAAPDRRPAARPHRYVGPPPIAPGGAFVGTFLLSLVVAATMSGGVFVPGKSVAELAATVAEHATGLRLVAFLQFGSAVALAVLSASLVGMLLARGVRVAGVGIAAAGGLLSAAMSALSALTTWVLADGDVNGTPALVAALSRISFVTGGVGHVVFLGLLMAGVSVPCLLLRLTPRWIPWLGLALAGVALLATLSLVLDPAGFLLPVARFAGFVWVIATTITLPRGEGRARPGQ